MFEEGERHCSAKKMLSVGFKDHSAVCTLAFPNFSVFNFDINYVPVTPDATPQTVLRRGGTVCFQDRRLVAPSVWNSLADFLRDPALKLNNFRRQ